MKVLYVQKRAHLNASGMFEGLVAAGHEVQQLVFSDSSGTRGNHLPTTQVDYYRLFHRIAKERKRHRLAVPRIGPILRLLRTFDPDVVILKTFRMHCVTVALLALLGGRTLVLLSDRPHGRGKGIDRWLGRLAPRRRIHAGGEGSPGTPVSSYGGYPSLTLPYPVAPSSTPRYGSSSAVPSHPLRLLAVTNFFNPRKRPWLLPEALGIAGLGAQFTVVYVGTGGPDADGLRRIREIEREHGLPPGQVLVDVDHDEVLRLYGECDAFVITSEREPFSVVIPEAMASGLPVICADDNGAAVCVQDGETGIVFATRDAEDLGRRLAQLAHEPEMLLRFGAAAYHASLRSGPAAWAEAFERLVVSPLPARRSWPAASATSP